MWWRRDKAPARRALADSRFTTKSGLRVAVDYDPAEWTRCPAPGDDLAAWRSATAAAYLSDLSLATGSDEGRLIDAALGKVVATPPEVTGMFVHLPRDWSLGATVLTLDVLTDAEFADRFGEVHRWASFAELDPVVPVTPDTWHGQVTVGGAIVNEGGLPVVLNRTHRPLPDAPGHCAIVATQGRDGKAAGSSPTVAFKVKVDA